MRKLALFAFLGLFLAYSLGTSSAAAQTANTGIVLGTVTDPGGAVVPDAKVELINTGTNEKRDMMTNSAGQYTFPGVAPGPYKVTVTKAGFATFVVSNLTVDVTKSYTVDVKLEIRATNEVIEVSAEARAELQTTDAVVGNVIGGTTLGRLPTLTRSATELMTLQPGSTPFDSAQTGFGDTGGTVTGARSDQNTFSLDGIDITDNVIAGGGFQTPIIPIGVDSVDEFRVGVTNNNAAFERSSGGLVSLVSKSGTNDIHGAAYWFHQNDELNANSWENNHLKDSLSGKSPIKRAETRDNRAGVSVGGPFIKNKTFFYANYEVRRFFQAFNIVRILPSDLLKQGILQFQDCSQGFDSAGSCQGGTIQQYNLKTAAVCNDGATTCDPRGLGISPTIQTLWNMLPKGNDPTAFGADGVNTIGFRSTVPAPLRDDFVAFKLDHNFTNKIHFFGRYMYSRDLTPNGGQVDFRGGIAKTSSNSNSRGDGFTSGFEWQLRSNLTNSFHAGWIRDRRDFTVIRPRDSARQLALPGTDSADGSIALAPGLVGTFPPFLDTVVDVDTQRGRHQAIYDSNKQYRDDLTWIKGKHTVVAGAEARWLPTIHDRDDKVIGSVNSLVAGLDADIGLGLRIPSANRPLPCTPADPATGAPAVTTNCLLPADQQRWDRFYASSLGMIDNVGILIVRDGQLNPQPLGDSLIARTTLRAYDFYLQDTWRIRPSLTLTYGLGYGWQTTPHELDGKQTFIVDHESGDKIINGIDYIKAKQKAAESGQTYNPNLAYLPIKKSGRSDVYSVDYGDVAPRASLAWNPSFRSGFLGKFIGDRKTVIRGGYGISYDRANTVQSVIIPMLGVGFAQTINLITPCNPVNTNPNDPTVCSNAVRNNPGLASFRVGVDGSIPVPPNPTASTSPVVPVGSAATVTYGEILSFQDDPDYKVGRSHMFDFTIQREVRGNMLMELGYVGRLGRDLGNSINFNSSPYMFKDTASGQTFAQAFDAVAAALRNNKSVTPQPWFENQFPSIMPGILGCGATNTECMVNFVGPNFINGNVSSMFIVLDLFRDLFGLPTYNNHQVLELFMRTHRDKSNYHALIFTLRNRGWHGLQFDMNYTFSKSLDQSGAVQNDARYYASSFNPNLEYGPSFFDRTHVFNAIYNYDLPFGKGHRLGSSHGWVNNFTGGWYTAGVWRFATGLPLTVTNGGDTFGGGLIFATPGALIPLVDPTTLETGAHFGVAGSGGIGTSGDPKSGGSGINYFADPEKASKQFRPILLASDGRTGRGHPLRGFNFWNWDARVGKTTAVTERFKTEFSFDFFNALNHVIFLDPAFDLTTPTNFGVVSAQYVPANRNAGSRWIQFGFRVTF